MDQFVNQYSVLLIAAGILLVAVLLVFRHKPQWPEILALGVIAMGLGIAWLIFHPVQTPLIADAQDVQSRIGQGQPVLLEFQSPYCINCTRLKPVVDRLEQELAGRLIVIRLNVQEPVGRELGRYYNFRYTPTFIFFDSQGREVWRQIGDLNVQRVRDSVK